MSGRARKWLLILGIVLILFSVLLILFALSPGGGATGQAQATLQPTLFLPPGGGG